MNVTLTVVREGTVTGTPVSRSPVNAPVDSDVSKMVEIGLVSSGNC